MNDKVYVMHVQKHFNTVIDGREYTGVEYDHDFYFTSIKEREKAKNRVQNIKGVLIRMSSHTICHPATVKRMIEQGLTTPYQKKVKEHGLRHTEGP